MSTRKMKGIRKIGAVLCILCILITAYVGYVTVSAQDSAKITTTSIISDNEEGVANVKVSYKLSENSGIWGLKFKSDYNHEIMELKSVELGDVFKKEEVVLPEKLDKEQFVFCASADELEDVTTNGTLVTLIFEVKEGASVEEYPVTVDIVQAINVSGKDVNIEVTNNKNDTEGDKDSEGNEDRIRGDVNGDKVVTLQDAQIALRVALLLDQLDDNLVADATGDGAVTLQDAQTILRLALLLPV